METSQFSATEHKVLSNKTNKQKIIPVHTLESKRDTNSKVIRIIDDMTRRKGRILPIH